VRMILYAPVTAAFIRRLVRSALHPLAAEGRRWPRWVKGRQRVCSEEAGPADVEDLDPDADQVGYGAHQREKAGRGEQTQRSDGCASPICFLLPERILTDAQRADALSDEQIGGAPTGGVQIGVDPSRALGGAALQTPARARRPTCAAAPSLVSQLPPPQSHAAFTSFGRTASGQLRGSCHPCYSEFSRHARPPKPARGQEARDGSAGGSNSQPAGATA
jgi:hypothetical protein